MRVSRAPRPFNGQHAGRHPIAGDTIVTAAGDRFDAPAWNFALDAHRGSNAGIMRWDVPIVVDGIEVGRLTDARWERLLVPIKEGLFVRWKDPNRGDGQVWHSGATAYNMGMIIRQFAIDMAVIGITSVSQITDGVLKEWAGKVAASSITVLNRRRAVSAALILLVVADRISESYGTVNRSVNPDDWMPEDWDDAAGDDVPGRYETLPKAILDVVVGAAFEIVEQHGSTILRLRAAAKARLGKRHKLRGGDWDAIKASVGTDGDLGILGILNDLNDLWKTETFLETACYIVIAFLSGARSSEVLRLKVGCCEEIPPGRTPARRWRLHGVIIKHRKVPEKHVWHVTEEVVLACSILERMHAISRQRTGSDTIFVTRTGGGSSRLGESFNGHASWNSRLKSFVRLVKAPLHDGKPWPLSTHQFRVSLAQWLVQEPYGTIGGSGQFGHQIKAATLRATVFEGYGRQDPQFRSLIAEFETEERVRRETFIATEAVLRGVAGRDITEKRSAAAQARLERDVRPLVQARIEDNISRKHVSKHRKLGRPIYQSATALCMFRPEQSACLTNVPEDERHSPALHRCRPMTCGNGVVTRMQIPMFLEPAEAYWADVIGANVSPGQRQTAAEELVRLRETLVPFLPMLESEAERLVSTASNLPPDEARAVDLQTRLVAVRHQMATIRMIYPDA